MNDRNTQNMIIRVARGKQNPYFLVEREVVQDNRLSYGARGVYMHLASLKSGEMKLGEIADTPHKQAEVMGFVYELVVLGYAVVGGGE